jgi:cytochrome b subunit of formate dehydrogenase/mono/diheme cytochrome c family protein
MSITSGKDNPKLANNLPAHAGKKLPRAPITVHRYERFSIPQRIAHVLLLASFTTLAITGLVQKYALSAISLFIIKILGGIEMTRLIHHSAAVLLMLLAIYHLLDAGYKIFVRRTRLTMLPGIKDVRDGWQALMYNLGLAKSRPQSGRYSFDEKLEYWALIWGTIIMGITGFMMWNPIITTRILPGEIIPAALAAHGGEALLAVGAIIIWHVYSVHLKHFNKSMWTGRLTEEEMLHEHPLELADLKAGVAERPVDPKSLRRRQVIYYPVASVLAVAMLLGIYGFVNGEKTTINTLPPVPNLGPVYVPQTPTPSPTPQPTAVISGAALTWDGSIGAIFQDKCSTCHGPNSFTGFSMDTYADFMKGGADGPVIVPGDPANSKLVELQTAGGHPGQLSTDELNLVKDWISAGASEK